MASLAPAPASNYRGRLAPSPTGYLHVGHARTFWTAWQRARDAGGALVMRMEDLDPERSQPVYAEAALEDLRWLGIRWQEGPDKRRPVCALRAERARRALSRGVAQAAARAAALFPLPMLAQRSRSRTGRSARSVRERRSLTCWTTSQSIPEPAGVSRLAQPIGPVRREIEPDAPAGSNWRFRVPDGEAIEFDGSEPGSAAICSRRRTLAILWCGVATAGPATSWLAWWTTRRWRSRKWCAGRIC